MPTKSSKSVTTKKSVKSTKAAAPKSTAKSSSKSVGKKFSSAVQDSRNKFVAGVVLVAAALLAIAIGFSSYQKNADTVNASGNLFLQSSDEIGSKKAGETFKVAVYEDSGSQGVNAVQGALTYSADKVKVVAVTTGEAFPQEAATDTSTPGLVRIARAINAQSAAVTGSKHVVTVEFEAVQDLAGNVDLAIDKSASLLVSSSSNQNIL